MKTLDKIVQIVKPQAIKVKNANTIVIDLGACDKDIAAKVGIMIAKRNTAIKRLKRIKAIRRKKAIRKAGNAVKKAIPAIAKGIAKGMVKAALIVPKAMMATVAWILKDDGKITVDVTDIAILYGTAYICLVTAQTGATTPTVAIIGAVGIGTMLTIHVAGKIVDNIL